MAGSTLDASVKIYGHRVDSVHLDAYRIAGTLGHQTEEDIPIADDVKNLAEPKKTRRVDRHHQSKVEQNPKALEQDKIERIEEYNLWNSVDFHISSDFGRIIIDPFDQPFGDGFPCSQKKVTLPSGVINDCRGTRTCGDLDNFSFTGWAPPDRRLSLSRNIIPIILKSNHEEIVEEECEISFRPVVEEPYESETQLAMPDDDLQEDAQEEFRTEDEIDQSVTKRARCLRFYREITKEERRRLTCRPRVKKLNSTTHKDGNIALTTLKPSPEFDVNYLFLLFINSKAALTNERGVSVQPGVDALEPPVLVAHNEDVYSEEDSHSLSHHSHHFADNLIPAPQQVEAVYVKYAKTAKKVDTKAVKASIWEIIGSEKKRESHTEPSSFMELHHRLMETLPKSASKNVSPQVSFVCLLHLANEKKFELVNTEDFHSINILVE
ncbi:Condensin complex subunit 2 [Thelohanellus kitauei]|uniref:Condensin complex subunit 2 n=1 Tax=Thelohanellus kitauei TaxID=669202 RepID=A0A0C2JAC0_THEKT|nr:Condensin complex subunit 2 [Thelohanellus kitauei]